MAALVTALALLGANALRPLGVHTNLLFVAAVAISAWYGGRGPGLVASVLAVVALAVFRPEPLPPVPGVAEGVYLVTFLFVASAVGATTESLRHARAQAVARAEESETLSRKLEQQMQEVQTLSERLQESNDSLSEALTSAESMAWRAMRLQEVTAALSVARTSCDVADVVVGRGLGVVGAACGLLARVDGDHLETVRASGYARGLEAQPLDDAPLLEEALKSGAPAWRRSSEKGRVKGAPAPARPCASSATQASVAVPLRYGGEIIGALALHFATPSALGATDHPFTHLLAQAAADALARARSYDAERSARREAELLAAARSDVLGVVAHDLRNPLGAVAAAAAMLSEETLTPERRQQLQQLTQRIVQRMNRLIGDLLDVTRLQAGRLTLDRSDVDVGDLVRETAEMCRHEAEERHVQLQIEVPDQGHMVHADEGRVIQALANLVGNALKFTAAGGRVSLSARDMGDEVHFRVADTGPGISPEHQVHLFDSFWQARGGDRRGVGLGLAITKGIVDAHGGRIWVESRPAGGSTFSFALPSRRGAAEADPLAATG